jgi:hypothetical protein
MTQEQPLTDDTLDSLSARMERVKRADEKVKAARCAYEDARLSVYWALQQALEEAPDQIKLPDFVLKRLRRAEELEKVWDAALEERHQTNRAAGLERTEQETEENQ